MGRKPKRLVYATEGLAAQVTACEMTVKSLEQTSPIGLSHALSLKKELIAIQVELQLNLVTMHVFTASFPEAEKVSVARLSFCSWYPVHQALDEIICLLRLHGIFETYAPRICLLQAQRYHMLGRKKQASDCYRACQFISNPGSEIHMLARMSLVFIEVAEGNMTESTWKINEMKNELYATESLLFIAAGKLLDAVTTKSIQRSK
jgi:hypothetical protein